VNKWCGVTTGIVALTFASTSSAKDSEDENFGMGAHVPVACDIQTSDFDLRPGAGRVTGRVLETCNTNRGFQVLATHRTLDTAENVSVSYNHQVTNLDKMGWSVISLRSGARYGYVPVTIDTANLQSQLTLSFSLVAV